MKIIKHLIINPKLHLQLTKKKRAKACDYSILNNLTNEIKCRLPDSGMVYKYSGNASLMIDHLKSFHKDKYDKVFGNEELQRKIDLPEFKFPKLSQGRTNEITKSLAKFIAIELKPLSILYSDSFKDLMCTLDIVSF